jgi:uncharacterized protein DUF5309
MPAIDQPVTTLSDTTAQIRVISDYIFNIDPMDTPVVAKLGLSSARDKFRLNVVRNRGNTKIELLEDTYHPLTTTMANGTTVSTSTLSFTVTDASLFQDGFEILVDSEYMVVSAVNTSTNTITVDSRAYGGTNATHATGATIEIVGMARKEGDDADYVGLTTLSAPFNYTAIFQKGVQVTGSENAFGQYGKTTEYDYQVNKVIPELSRWIERMFFHGQRRLRTGSVSSSFGGIGTFVTSNSSSISTTITKVSLDTVSQAIYDDGGVADMLIMPTGGATNLHTLLDTSSFINITQENTVYGMRPLVTVNTQFFENIQMLTSRHCPAKKAWALDSSKVGFFDYRPFFEQAIAVTGDSKKSEVIGEFGLLVANGSLGHGFITTSNSGGL